MDHSPAHLKTLEVKEAAGQLKARESALVTQVEAVEAESKRAGALSASAQAQLGTLQQQLVKVRMDRTQADAILAHVAKSRQ